LVGFPLGGNRLLGIVGGKLDLGDANTVVHGSATFGGVLEDNVVEFRAHLRVINEL
jgi:hypothetical protein